MQPQPQPAPPPPATTPVRYLYLILYLCIIPYELAHALGLISRPATLRATVHRSPACHTSADLAHLGPWAQYLDVCAAPLLNPLAAEPFTQLASHERNLDFNSFLYAENDLYYVLDTGPACLARYYGNVGKFAYKEPEYNDQTYFILELDGEVVLNATLRALFMAPPSPLDGARHGEASAFAPSEAAPRPSRAAPQAWPHASPLFPVLTYALERNVSLLGAWLMQAPFCAARRMRIAYRFGQLWDAAAFPALHAGSDVQAHTEKVMAGAASCIWEDTRCPVVHYNAITGLRFPGGVLPPHWVPPGGLGALAFPTAPALERAGLPSADLTHLWNAARLLGDAERAARGAASSVGCGRLMPAGEPLVLFSSPAGRGGGVVTALTLDFPDAPHLLHSPHVRLEAFWDDAVEGGGAGEAAGGDAATSSATWASAGWSDERPIPPPGAQEASWAAATASAARRRGGARLSVDLEALLGPTHMHAGHTPSCRKELYYLGELPRAGYPCQVPGAPPSSEPRSGLYLTLPMPFWRAARLQVVFTGEKGDWVAQAWSPYAGAGARAWAEGVRACWSVAVAPRGGGGGAQAMQRAAQATCRALCAALT